MNATIPPPPQHGIHTWVASAARTAQLKGLSPDEAGAAIRAYEGQLRRPLQHREIEDAIRFVYSTAPTRTAARAKPAKPCWKPSTLSRVPKFTLVDLRVSSPFPRPWENAQHEFVRALFPDRGGLICVGASTQVFATRTIEELGRERLARAQFIVPAYMSARSGLTQDGRPSEHCLGNCGSRRFIVCDFDDPAPDVQPGIIRRLAKFRPLVAVVGSGGKSLHAWFPSHGEGADADFWWTAIAYGADPALMRNRSSFARMPGGTRDNGNMQTVHYFDLMAAKAVFLRSEGGTQ